MNEKSRMGGRHRGATLPRNFRVGGLLEGNAVSIAALVLFLTSLALLGGSSRYDAAQLVLLRPLCCIFLGYALYHLRISDIIAFRWPVILLVLFTTLLAIQLIPLPYEIWSSLPGREPVALLSREFGMDDIWRPISLAPWRTWNALANLIVPIGLLALIINQRKFHERILLWAVLGLGLVNALLGMQQVLTGAGPLYFYEFTNRGAPVGFFANTNHSATFGSLSLVIAAYLGATSQRKDRFALLRGIVIAGAYLVILMVIVINSSRAGLLTGVVAFLSTALLLWFGKGRKSSASLQPSRAAKREGIFATGLAISLILFALLLAAVLFFGERSEALRELMAADSLEEVRALLLPIFWQMAQTFFPVGIGYGAFEDAFYIFEPEVLIGTKYLNQAHNDWMQWIIEGGLPAFLLMIGFLGWILRLMQLAWRQGKTAAAIFLPAFFIILGMASAVDYPLRTPLFQGVAVICLTAMAYACRRSVTQKTLPSD
jgi:O-antigen ligase